MSQPAMQTLEVPISELTNEMLGHLHRLGAEIYARHARKPDVLVFSRPLPLSEEPLGALRAIERDGALAGQES